MMARFKAVCLAALYFFMTGILLVFPALYNRYPLMYFDSGAYMEMAVHLKPSYHRAIGYPLLIKLTGLMVSNWPLILLQGFLVSFLLYRLMKAFIPAVRLRGAHVLAVIVLSLASAIPWYAAQLMPDIWTLIMVLSLACIMVEPVVSKPWFGVYALIVFAALLTHLSHVPLLALILLSVWLVRFVWEKLEIDRPRLRLGLPAAIVLVATIATCTYNAARGLGFNYALSGNVFLTANLAEMGLLHFYLDENCPAKGANLCQIKDELPLETGGFLWDPSGPVQQFPGGWAAVNEAYAPIVTDFLTRPRYLKWLLFGSVKATFKQMFQIEPGSGLQYAYGEGTPPYWPMKAHFKQELNEYLTSVQNKGDALPLDFFRWVNYLSIFLGLAILASAISRQQLTPGLVLLLFIFVSAYFYNAAITGVLANVYERLQARLLPMLQIYAVLLVLMHYQGTVGLLADSGKTQDD